MLQPEHVAKCVQAKLRVDGRKRSGSRGKSPHYAPLAERISIRLSGLARGPSGPKGPFIDPSRSGSCELPPDLAGHFATTNTDLR